MPRGIRQPEGKPYTGRREDCRVLNVTIDTEAMLLLREWATGAGSRSLGQVVSRLAYAERTRREEREAMQARLRGVLSET